MRLDTATAAVALPPSSATAKRTTGTRQCIPSSLNTPGRRPPRTIAVHCNVSVAKRPSVTPTLLHLSNLQRVLRNSSGPPLQSLNVGDEIASALDITSLDLSDVLPAARKPSEMSPKRLRHLRCLLSSSPNTSPRRTISHRWRDLHGSDDWSGLLDPLDEDLRREVVRYGEHVQAAYHAFYHEDDHHVTVADRAYRVTEHLHATSSIVLPPCIRQERSSWIGYVAVCDDHREIQRLGRREIVVALRGTATCLEWAENLRNVLVPIPRHHTDGADKGVHVAPRVECGFLSLFQTTPPDDRRKSLSDSVTDEILRLIEAYHGEQLSITITGHSLGAALALLVADHLTACAPELPPTTVFSFGGPRVGNRGFADRINRRGVKVLRVVNEHDVVTRVPGVFASEAMDRKLRHEGNGVTKRIMNVLDEHMPWAYSHVGNELRVDSRRSPYLRSDADLACCHDLEAYLHLVDGFLSSHTPFRCNAKRSIVRLMRQQGSKLKKLCNNKKSTLGSALPAPVPIGDGDDGNY